MAYIVSRNQRFYVVANDGIDPAAGQERRRWHLLAAAERTLVPSLPASRMPRALRHLLPRAALTLGQFVTDTWLPDRQRRIRATTAYRYGWMIDRYINSAIGDYSLRSIRTDHLNDLCVMLAAGGGHDGRPLSGKTVHEVHLIVRSALAQTTAQGLTRANVAVLARWPRPHGRLRRGPETWSVA